MALFKIALTGDSMMATWGPECPELLHEFKRLYSHSDFIIENHALSDTRAGYALWRMGNDYEVNGERRTSLSYSNPDVVIVESFAYTNRADGPEGLGEYRDVLRRMFEEIERTTTAKAIFCITLPPDRDRFMENISNYAFTSKATRQRMADDVQLYLDEARRIAQDENWPVADMAAEVEKRVTAKESYRRFINQADNLTPSRYGFSVIAQLIVRTIDNHRMIEEVIAK